MIPGARSALTAALATAVLCCANPPSVSPGVLHGALVPDPFPRPKFTLRRLDGRPVAFDSVTKGTLTLLFFGYTNCPDVCPATMANLGAVMGRLTGAERRRIRVVFVTTDPARDTPELVGAWLARFDRDFVGLVGTADEIAVAERAARVSPAQRDGDGNGYMVSHAAQVIVVSPDDTVHIQYPFGTRQREWTADLPVLLRRWSGAPR